MFYVSLFFLKSDEPLWQDRQMPTKDRRRRGVGATLARTGCPTPPVGGAATVARVRAVKAVGHPVFVQNDDDDNNGDNGNKWHTSLRMVGIDLHYSGGLSAGTSLKQRLLDKAKMG